MPEEPTVPATSKKRNERNDAKFSEDVDRLIAEAERLGVEYNPPNELANLKAKRTAALTQRTVHQASTAEEETARNQRENLYKPLRGDVSSLVNYVKSSGKPQNEIDALYQHCPRNQRQARQANRRRRRGQNISVTNLSFASLADNYSRFIKQYASLGIATTEDMYKAETHRTKLAAIQQANADVIAAESAADTSGVFERSSKSLPAPSRSLNCLRRVHKVQVSHSSAATAASPNHPGCLPLVPKSTSNALTSIEAIIVCFTKV